MPQFSWSWYYALKDKHEQLFDWIPCKSGIYKWTREEINGLKCEYVGQAKDLFERHFDYYCIQCGMRPWSAKRKPRPIELSLIKHKDWEFQVIELCDKALLNRREKHFIKKSTLQPNTKNYNVIFGASERKVSRGGYKPLNDYKKRLKSLINGVKLDFDKQDLSKGITITYHLTKKGKPNQKSFKAMNEIINEIEALKNE